MADSKAAIEYVLSFEDRTLSGAITLDGGGRTRYGIAEKYHPELSSSLFYTSMGNDKALKIAQSIYDISYCHPLCIEEIASQDIANKLLSLGVNIGVKAASMMLQEAVMVAGDGRIGPITLMALESAPPANVLESLRSQAEKYYEDLIAQHPEDAIYRAGWMRRAAA